METGGITEYIDVAQATLYVFWAFFFGLIYYLRREDRREGYPLVAQGEAGREAPAETVANAVATDPYPGAPLTPVGNPMLAGVGPGSWGKRADTPDLTDDGEPKIMPLRAATDYYLDPEGPDPRGYKVVGADGLVAGEVVEIWVDRNELLVRFYEVAVQAYGETKCVLVPGAMATINVRRRTLNVVSILAAQFADVPTTRSRNIITTLEEDYITSYYSAGTLYATPERLGPIL